MPAIVRLMEDPKEILVVNDPRIFREVGLPALQPYVGPGVGTFADFMKGMRTANLIEGHGAQGRIRERFLLKIGGSGVHSRLIDSYPSLLYYLLVAVRLQHIKQTTVEPFIPGAFLVSVLLRDGRVNFSVQSRDPLGDHTSSNDTPQVFKDHHNDLEILARMAAGLVEFIGPVEVMILLAPDGKYYVLKVKGVSGP